MSPKIVSDEDIIVACENNATMAKACAAVGLHATTFIKRAKALGVYKPNQGAAGTEKISPKSMTRERFFRDILSGNLLGFSGYSIKKYLFKFGLKENKCELCGQLPEWNGRPLTLQLDHINGNHYDNRLDNLRILCPNCHTQTDTFAAKSKA